MAGVKGRSGGARPNSGGARPGAGRKPKEPVVMDAPAKDADMLDLLKRIALGQVDASQVQVRAAIAAVQYTHTKRADGGKREEKQKAAEKVAGRFSAAAAPKLVAAGGKRV